MSAIHRAAAAFSTAMLLSLPFSAMAQQPICRPPVQDQPYLGVCLSGVVALRNVSTLLARFSVDHLFKPPPPAFSYTPLDLAAPLAGRQFESHESLRTFVANLAPIDFTRLDSSTGTFKADFEGAARSFEGTFDPLPSGTEPTSAAERQSSISLQLPAALDGGYWRTPDVLQMAFWRDHRPSFELKVDDETVVASEVACVSLSANNLKIDLADEDQPEIIVSIWDCE